MNNTTIISILISLLTISSTLFVVILQRKTEKLKIIENQLSDNKYKAYINLVNVFYDILREVKNKKETNNQIIGEKLFDAKKDIFMFGSDAVFKKFSAWLTFTSEHPDDKKHLKLYLEMMLEIRKDMHSKTNLSKNDIMQNLIQNRADLKELEHLWK